MTQSATTTLLAHDAGLDDDVRQVSSISERTTLFSEYTTSIDTLMRVFCSSKTRHHYFTATLSSKSISDSTFVLAVVKNGKNRSNSSLTIRGTLVNTTHAERQCVCGVVEAEANILLKRATGVRNV